MDADVGLRRVGPADEDFLLGLFAAVRGAQFAALPGPVRGALLPMQYQAQQRQYEQAWPAGDHQLILRHGRPIGRLLVARTSEEFRLVDIALLPAHQGCGIGSGLLRMLLREAGDHGLPLTLHVAKDNPARRLYLRLGFRVTDEDGMYAFLRKDPLAG